MSQTYTVEIRHQGQKHTIQVPDNKTILEIALDSGIDLPTSCGAGVCTTCASKIIEGTVDQSTAMGISPDLQKEGYVLICVAYPRSNLIVESGQEDAVYQRQFART